LINELKPSTGGQDVSLENIEHGCHLWIYE